VGEHVVFYGEKEKGEKEKEEKNQKNSFSDNGKITSSCLDSVSLTKNEEMKTFLAELVLAAAMATTPVMAQDSLQVKSEKLRVKSEELRVMSEELQIIESEVTLIEEEMITLLSDTLPAIEGLIPPVTKPIQLTFIYPLGTGWVKSACNSYHVSLNILGGVTGQTKGIELGSLFNINMQGAIGAQFAGLFNCTGSACSDIQSRNVQFGGLFNITNKGKSAQFGGLFNVGDTAWIQGGGLFSISKNAFVQLSGIFNYANTALFQAAGIGNTAKQSGAQFAGIFNGGCTVPFQAAGIANVAEKSVCQIAGIFNKTKEGRFQMGLINVRDTADGVSLGLINIVKKGGILEAGIEAGEFVHTALTFRSGVQRLYSIINVGYNYTEKFWTVGGGFGTSFKLVGNLSLNLELLHATFYKKSLITSGYNLFQFNPVLNYRFAKHFKIYAGPSLNLLIQHYRFVIFDESSRYYQVKVPYSIIHNTKNNTLDMWIGVVGGIKF
jgi:hypothetical protein